MNNPMRILVVEDEKALAHMMAIVLGGPTAKVVRALNGWEALIKVRVAPRPFDVVITDHRMPRVGGLELVRRLRAQDFAGKIMVLSAYLSDEDIAAYEALNVDMMMSKPFDFDELQQAMSVLNRKPSLPPLAPSSPLISGTACARASRWPSRRRAGRYGGSLSRA